MKNGLVGLALVVLVAALGLGAAYMLVYRQDTLTRAFPAATPSPKQLLGGDKDAHGCIGSAGYTWCEEKRKCLRVWEEACGGTPTAEQTAEPTNTVAPSPTGDGTEALISAVKAALVAKHGPGAEALAVTVSETEGEYAKGMASEAGGGGLWFAAKAQGTWKLVWDGNGIITCADIAPYPQFPSSLIPECFDGAKGTTVKR